MHVVSSVQPSRLLFSYSHLRDRQPMSMAFELIREPAPAYEEEPPAYPCALAPREADLDEFIHAVSNLNVASRVSCVVLEVYALRSECVLWTDYFVSSCCRTLFLAIHASSKNKKYVRLNFSKLVESNLMFRYR